MVTLSYLINNKTPDTPDFYNFGKDFYPQIMKYEFRFFQDEKDFFQTKEAWQSLYDDCINRLPFQTPSWYYSWWKFLSQSSQIFFVTVSKGTRLVAVAPFYIGMLSCAKIKVRALQFIGSGPSEINDILIRPGEDESLIVSELFRQLFQRLGSDFDVIFLEETVKTSTLYNYLNNTGLPGQTSINFSKSFFCPHLDLDDQEKINKTCSGRDFSRKFKKLSTLGQVEYVFTSNQNKILELMPEIISLHNRQWSKRKDTSQFESSDFQNFLKKLLEDINFQDKIFVSMVKLNDKIVSFDFGYAEDGTIHPSRTAFDQDLDIYSPGFIMNCFLYKKTSDSGFKTINLGRGRQAYKMRVASRIITTNHIIISSKKIRPLVVTKYLQFYFSLKFKLRGWHFFQNYTTYGLKNLLTKYFSNIFRSDRLAAVMISGKIPSKKSSPDLSCQAIASNEIFESEDYLELIPKKKAIENTYRGSTLFIIKKGNEPIGLFWLSQAAYKIPSIDELIHFEQNDYCVFGFEPFSLFGDPEIIQLATRTIIYHLKGRRVGKLIAILPANHKAALACFKKAGFANLFSRVLLKLFNLKAFRKLPYGKIS